MYWLRWHYRVSDTAMTLCRIKQKDRSSDSRCDFRMSDSQVTWCRTTDSWYFSGIGYEQYSCVILISSKKPSLSFESVWLTARSRGARLASLIVTCTLNPEPTRTADERRIPHQSPSPSRTLHTQGSPGAYWHESWYQTSSAVAERPHDASCHSIFR